jgi:heme/copper-type cytochrome/quinol oxidase subunit 2
MFFTIRAVEQTEYEAWLAEKSPAGAETAEAEPAEAEVGEATEPGATPGVAPGATDETSEEAA